MTTAEPDTKRTRPEGTGVGRAMDRGWDVVERRWASLTTAIGASVAGLWWKRVERPNLADWALLGAICALAAVTFLYGDVKATFEHSFNFLDSVFAGRPQDFYQIAIAHASFGHPAVYDVPIYAIFGIWNFPTYLLYRFADFNYLHSTPAQLWLKLMLILFALVAARLMMSIARLLGMSAARSKWVAFYFLSSMSLFVPVFVIVQYDIISVTFMLAGLRAYLKGQTRSFLLWFLAANTLKLFGLFIFIPLVLLREKRLPRVFGQLIVGVLGLALCRLFYRGNVDFQASTGGFTELMLDRLHTAGFTWQSSIPVPLFVVFLVGLMIFAYAKRPSSQRELQAFAIYVSLAAFLVFCAIVPLNPYWIALVAPFSILIIFANPRHLTLNSLLEVSISTSLFLIYMLVGYSMYNAGIFTDLVFGKFVHAASPQRYATPGDILKDLGLGGNNVIFLVGFMLACVIAVLVLNYPRAEFILAMPNAQPIERSVVWVRIGVLFGFCGLLFAMYLIPARATVYSSTSSAPTVSKVDILQPGASVEEQIALPDTVKVDALQVGIDASQVTWIDTALVNVSVIDPAGKTLYSGSVPANSIKVGLATYPTKNLTLEGGKSYTLRISSSQYHGEAAHVQLNPADNQFVTTENGDVADGDVVLVIQGSHAR